MEHLLWEKKDFPQKAAWQAASIFKIFVFLNLSRHTTAETATITNRH
jgi:hypothetical protein